MEGVDVLLDHQLDRARRVEARQQDEGGARPPGGVQGDGLAEGVEEGQRAERDVVGPDVVGVEGVDRRVHHQVEVAEHGALGDAGGAAGVEDDGRVVGVAGDVRGQGLGVRREPAELGPVAEREHPYAGRPRGGGPGLRLRGVAQEQGGPAVAQDVLDLGRRQQQVHRHDDGTGRGDGVVRDGEVGGVRCHQRHPVPRPDVQAGQGARLGAGPPPHLGEGQAQVALDQRLLVGTAPGVLGEDGGDGEGCHGVLLRFLAAALQRGVALRLGGRS